ncbi:hypothetical protein [Hwanghaeella sp.]|uniref:hypothetical protein n=1 Tax=Hwanghaeella sp. TaxID=2605943 RepID=UPI003CCBAC0F
MKKLVRIVALASILATVAACQGYTLVKGGSPVEIASGMKATPARSWSKLSSGKYQLWTVDGPVLQQILFGAAIQDGEELFPNENNRKQKLPEFKKSMSELEVAELYRDTMLKLGASNFDLLDIRPKTVGGKQGFRFEFDFTMEQGLQKSGVGEAVLEGDKLYYVIYTGAKLHYYPKNLPDAEQVMQSVQIL